MQVNTDIEACGPDFWPITAGAVPLPAAAFLTPRPPDVLRCMMQGQPDKHIARKLGLRA